MVRSNDRSFACCSPLSSNAAHSVMQAQMLQHSVGHLLNMKGHQRDVARVSDKDLEDPGLNPCSATEKTLG